MSNIEWTDRTWNPVTGCTKVSAGCANCYAEPMSHRLGAMAKADIAGGRNPGAKAGYLGVTDNAGAWTGKVICHPERLGEPGKVKKPTTWFVNSMGDLFHEGVPDEFIREVFWIMAMTDEVHRYIILTKRAKRLRRFLDALDVRMPNVMVGVSCSTQAMIDERVPELVSVWAGKLTPVRLCLSLEPLLDRVDIKKWLRPSLGTPEQNAKPDALKSLCQALDWVVVGCESGPKRRVCDRAWVESVVFQCMAGSTPCFIKQIPINGKVGKDPAEWSRVLRVRQFPWEEVAQ